MEWRVNQLYFSSYHLAPQLISYYLDALIQHRIEYLWGYTSSLYALALDVILIGRTDLTFRVAITNAEPLFDYQREAIEKAFHCPVRETYGMAEIVTAASECQFVILHLWLETGVLEIDTNGSLIKNGNGNFVATGLINTDMPLIRYMLGDFVDFRNSTLPCECGRTLPILGPVDGRSDDVLYTKDGRRIGRLDPNFKTQLPIYEVANNSGITFAVPMSSMFQQLNTRILQAIR